MSTFDEQYPNIAWWVQDGRIEIGRDEYSDSFIRVIDEGGLIWEREEAYETVAEALAEADAATGVGRMRRVYEHGEGVDSDAQDLRIWRGEGVSTGADVGVYEAGKLFEVAGKCGRVAELPK